jgi:hypothetical protein
MRIVHSGMGAQGSRSARLIPSIKTHSKHGGGRIACRYAPIAVWRIIRQKKETETREELPTLNRTLAYDPVKDFAPLSRVGSYTFMLAIKRDLAVASVAELIAYAKANPGKLSYASGNCWSVQ